MKKHFIIFCLGVIFTLWTVTPADAQCGPDGTQPCPKKTPATSSQAALAQAAKQRAERERLERLRAEKERLKRKQLEKKQLEQQKTKETTAMIDNALKYRDFLKNQKPIDLFPVGYVTLGKTGEKLFSLTPSVKKCENTGNCYIVEGIYYYLDEKGIADSLYLTNLRLEGMPENWKKAGFDWQLSFNEWRDLFKNLGYASLVTKDPTVVTANGVKYLKAEFLTNVATTDGRMQLVLNFKYGIGKTTVDARGTLFAIEVNRLN